FSRKFVDTYLEEVQNDWQGHFEALWPTIALHRGLRMEDIGEWGFVPPSCRDQRYRQGPECTLRAWPPVAERYYPVSEAELPRGQLCHPIKTAAWRSQSDKPRPREQPERAALFMEKPTTLLGNTVVF